MNFAGFEAGPDAPLFVIAGPCVIESEELVLRTAERLKEITGRLGMPFVFKASFDKANRTSHESFRGPGLEEGLRILERARRDVGVPVLTDVHEDTPLRAVAEVVDVLQTPAMLCRQTNFIMAVARQGLPVNLKKGQFLSPEEMASVVEKARSTGNDRLLVCERGVAFGYRDLIVDMRGLAVLRETGAPVVFDATHAAQRPGSLGRSTGGDRRHVPL
ncbi:MAG: 3-deoxy-8-phosphooctulonate synthase, partial [Gammaproteobacteria bacterium]